ncbi:DUF4153 domain-containing protein [Paraconexibacter algicola]|uniref:DUF4173 domain-containing protein n=1 Tax=Paraconexibacter algicola TaxID=2133960 RepID=A0A2T4UMQ1_9ACTN|nr:DUF4173 domain-containing protein [Paraconexibacter algicola]PTL60510.1 DUF4173 domain-containing protein [Paraconexibacter algicola]
MSRPVLCRSLAAALLAAVAVAHHRVGLALAVVLLLVLGAALAAAPRRSVGLGAIAALLAVQPVLRDAAWVLALTVPAFALACAAIVRPPGGWAALRALPAVPLRWARGGALVAGALRRALPDGSGAAGTVGPLLRGAALAAALVAAFGTLLVSADGAFAQLAGGLADVEVRTDVLVARAVLAVVVLATCGALAHAAARGTEHGPAPRGPAPGRIELRVALGALTLLFALFVAVQLRVLFGGAEYVRRTTGLGYGDYARQGVVQLLLVAALTLAVVAVAARRRDPVVRALLGTICLLVLVVLASALHRVVLVQDAYGLTRVRLAGGALVVWLGALVGLVLAAGTGPRVARHAPRAALLLTLGSVAVFSLANPDGRIAQRAADRARAGEPVDLPFLQSLSADALPALRTLPVGLRAAAVAPLQARLRRPDGAAGWNIARWRAR